MEYNVRADVLETYVSNVVSVVPKTTPKPILQMLLMSVKGGNVEFKATDLTVELKCVISEGVKVKSEGETLIDAFRFATILKTLGDKECNIKKTTKNIVVKCGKSVFKLLIGEPADHPDIKSDKPMVAKCEIPSNDLLSILDRADFAVGDGKDARFALESVCLRAKGAYFECVTADGKRLAWSKLKLGESMPEKTVFSALLFSRTLDIFKKMASKSDSVVTLEDYESIVTMKFGNYSYSIIPAVGKYPDYENMIKKPSTPLTIKIKREEFIHVLSQVIIFSSTVNRSVWLEASGSKMKIFTQSASGGEADVEIGIELNKEENFKMLISAKYMLDILNVVEEDEVILNCVGEEVPIHIHGKNYHYCLMPLVSME